MLTAVLVVVLAAWTTVIALFAPILLAKYDQWIKEETAPAILQVHPYLSMVVSGIGVLLVTMLLIWALIRELWIQRRKHDTQENTEIRLKRLEDGYSAMKGERRGKHGNRNRK